MATEYSLRGTVSAKTSLSGKTNGAASLSANFDESDSLSGQTVEKESLSGKTNGKSELAGGMNYVEKGDPGDSAYDIAVKEGFKGTEAEWLASLKGKDGSSPTIVDGYWYVDGVNTNIKAEGKDGKDGKNYTLTNYDIARIAEAAAQKHDTSHLQPKTDERLETTSKDVVGAINELASDGSIQTWVLYDDLERASGFDYEFNFTSNGVSYMGMEGTLVRFVGIDGESYEGFRVVYNKSDGSGTEVYNGFVSGWKDTAYQTIVTPDTQVYDKVYDRTLSISQALKGIANKKPTGLNTKSQTLVGAINEVNEKIVENADSFEEQVSKTNFGKWISNFVGNATDFITALIAKIKDVVKTEEVAELENEDEARSSKTVVGAIQKANRRTTAIENGTTKVGTSTKADKLSTARKITFTGDVSGEVSFDGSEDKNVDITVLNGGGGANIILSNLAGATYKLNDIIEGTFFWNIDFTSNGTSYYSMSGSMTLDIYTVNYDSTKVFRTRNGDGTSTWTDTAYQYVEITGGEDATNPEAIEWFNTHGKLMSVDLSNLATVDNITRVNINCEANSYVGYDDTNGIAWDTWVEIETENGGGAFAEFSGRVPIVAGNGVEFELDEENQVVRINATGGGSSSDDSIVGTWVFNEQLTPLGKSVEVSFTSDGSNYVAIENIDGGDSVLYYSIAVGDETDPVYSYRFDWENEAYRTIEILEEPTDEVFISWLKENATKQGGSSSGSNFEMPQIRFANAIYTNRDKIVDDMDNPLKLTVEIVGGGALQVGDSLQICAKRTYGYKKADGVNTYRKQKLRYQQEYVITEDDLDKRFLTITTDGSIDKWLFKNNRNRTIGNEGLIDTLSPFYLRIKRPIYKETSDGYVPVDANFSNIVTVWKTYNLTTGEVSIK